MPEESRVWLDEELQIIRQQIIGPADETCISRIIDQTTQCTTRLKDPANVFILMDGRNMGKISAKGRQMLTQMQKKPDLKKVATWGMGPIDRTMARFTNMATGMNKVMVFKDEKSAIEWLVK